MKLDSSDNEPIGLIAGQGDLPLIVARGMRAAGRRVVCVGLRDQFDAALPGLCDVFKPAGIAQPAKWIRILKRGGASRAVMVGRVSKKRMHDPLRMFRQIPDWRAIRVFFWRMRNDRRNAALLKAVADELESSGITLIDSTEYIPDHLASAGVMTQTQPTAQQRADIEFGWPLLIQTTQLDIGQAIAVRDRDVIAVEAVEGTSAMISRAGELCRAKGWTLLKTTRPGHDMRADVPTIGVETIERMVSAGGGCIALGVGRVILIDKPKVIAAADRAKIAIVGVDLETPNRRNTETSK